MDEETGLYHYRRRAYDPEAGRFLQRDPLGTVDGPNLYTYASSRPTSRLDPLGTDDDESGGLREAVDEYCENSEGSSQGRGGNMFGFADDAFEPKYSGDGEEEEVGDDTGDANGGSGQSDDDPHCGLGALGCLDSDGQGDDQDPDSVSNSGFGGLLDDNGVGLQSDVPLGGGAVELSGQVDPRSGALRFTVGYYYTGRSRDWWLMASATYDCWRDIPCDPSWYRVEAGIQFKF
jgi:hypothetical protein